MHKRLWLTLAAPALVLGIATAASATGSRHDSDGTLEATLSGTLPDYESARLFKHHHQLFAVVSNSDNSISIYGANRLANDWEIVANDAEPIAELVASTAAISTFAVDRQYLYAGTVNTDGIAEVWRIHHHARPASWEIVGASGLGDDANTTVLDLVRVRDQGLYALTENAAGNGLFKLNDGSWEQVGEYGLGVGLSDAVSAGMVRVVGDVVNVASASGVVYQASVDDLTTWTSIKDFTEPISAMRGRFVATNLDGQVKVYEADADNVYTQVGETDLGDTDNAAVTRFTNISRHPSVLVENSVDGAAYYQLDNDGAWEAKLEGGFGNSNNLSVTDYIPHRGDHYLATINTSDGSEIYQVSK